MSQLHTIVLSDIHLSEAEPNHPLNPLWKRFKRKRFFVDRTFRNLVQHLLEMIPGKAEMILNGDIFDFDSVLNIPTQTPEPISWLERRRGLNPEEWKSVYKMETILKDHPVWIEALREFLDRGNDLIFVIGNHDMELHWPAVQAVILRALNLDPAGSEQVRFCEWFYVSNGDTLIEHGNQYDAYCVCGDPIHPLIRRAGRIFVRLPFGNLANKYMANGMGLLNPHVESTFIMTFREYLVFFYRYMARVQPTIIVTWFWSALATLFSSLTYAFLPSLKDPLTTERKIEDIAVRSRTTPNVVRGLREIHAHPAAYHPLRLLRELWLDRGLLLLGILFLSFQILLVLNVFSQISLWWFVIPACFLMPAFIFYASSVKSEVYEAQASAQRSIELATTIAGVKRIIMGHTHREHHRILREVEWINTGNWSPAYKDVECTQPYGRKCFAWIRPDATGARISTLEIWEDPGTTTVQIH